MIFTRSSTSFNVKSTADEDFFLFSVCSYVSVVRNIWKKKERKEKNIFRLKRTNDEDDGERE